MVMTVAMTTMVAAMMEITKMMTMTAKVTTTAAARMGVAMTTEGQNNRQQSTTIKSGS